MNKKYAFLCLLALSTCIAEKDPVDHCMNITQHTVQHRTISLSTACWKELLYQDLISAANRELSVNQGIFGSWQLAWLSTAILQSC